MQTVLPIGLQRLLELIEVLRRHRQPVSGRTLAGELDISIRTLYRDIATLQAQGAVIARLLEACAKL